MFEAPAVASLPEADILASLSAFARAFETDRETLRRCLLDHGVQHVSERSGRGLYSLRDVYRAWTAAPTEGDDNDPDKLSEATLRRAFRRKAWWQGEREKLHLQRERRALVDALDVEQTLGKLNQLYVRGLETLEDVLERDAGLTPEQAQRMQRHVDQLREDLYKQVINGLATDPDSHTDESAPPAAGGVATSLSKESVAPAMGGAGPAGGSALADGIAFLRRELAGGPRRTSDLIAAARELAISEGTLRRAKAELGNEIKAKRDGRAWAWQLTRA